jgi:hypothetical protein
VWEHRVVTVVVLSILQQSEHPWSIWTNQQKRFGNIILSPTEEGLLCGFQTKDFSLRQHNESGGMKVRLIFCPEWSRDDGGKTAVTSSSTSADVESANAENKVIYNFFLKGHKSLFCYYRKCYFIKRIFIEIF